MSFRRYPCFSSLLVPVLGAALARRLRLALVRRSGPVVPPLPDALAPDWLRPLCLQRQLAKAVQARLAWRKAHPKAPNYWAEKWTSPDWDQDAWTPYNVRWLHGYSVEGLTARFQIDLERLVRIMEVPPSVLGAAIWTHSALGSCERLAQLYQEVLRRYGALGHAALCARLLDSYICWEPAPQPAAAPIAPPASSTEAAPVPAVPLETPIGV